MEGEHTTFADWDFKKVVTIQLVTAGFRYVDYKANPNQLTETDARKAIAKLAFLITPKLYVLNDAWAVSFFAYFELHPEQFHLQHLETAIVILRECCQKLGLTKFESFQLPKHQAYLEQD